MKSIIFILLTIASINMKAQSCCDTFKYQIDTTYKRGDINSSHGIYIEPSYNSDGVYLYSSVTYQVILPPTVFSQRVNLLLKFVMPVVQASCEDSIFYRVDTNFVNEFKPIIICK